MTKQDGLSVEGQPPTFLSEQVPGVSISGERRGSLQVNKFEQVHVSSVDRRDGRHTRLETLPSRNFVGGR